MAEVAVFTSVASTAVGARPALAASAPPTTILAVEVSVISPLVSSKLAVTDGSAIFIAAASSAPVIAAVTATFLPLIVISSVAVSVEVRASFRAGTFEPVAVAIVVVVVVVAASVESLKPIFATSVPEKLMSLLEVSVMTPVSSLKTAVMSESLLWISAARSVPVISTVISSF